MGVEPQPFLPSRRCSAVVTPDVRWIFKEGPRLLVRFPTGPRLSPSLWPPGKQRSRMREGIEKGHSSDLWPDVAIGHLQLRDGFCYRGTPKQIPPAPPANVGLRFQPFRGRSLAFRVKGAVAELVKLDFEIAFCQDDTQRQHSNRFLFDWFSCRLHSQMQASCWYFGTLHNWFDCCCFESLQSFLGIGCEDFVGCFSVVNQSAAVQDCGAHALQDLNTTCDGSLILNFTVELMVFGHSWRFWMIFTCHHCVQSGCKPKYSQSTYVL